MDNPQKYGLLMDTFDPNSYFLGGGFLGTTEINPNGDWTGFCPLPEYQDRNKNGIIIDTQDCTIFGMLNAYEILFSFVLQEDRNFSERFIAIVSGASRTGNAPQAICDVIRKYGLIDEIELPFDDPIDTLDKFFSPNPMSSSLLKKGQEFLKNYKLGDEWVYPIGTIQTIEQQNIKIENALKRSPVAISVSAWHPDENDGYDQQWAENHWISSIVGSDKEYWKVFDSYDKCIKKYSKKSKISMAKIFTVKKLTVEDKQTTFTKFWNWVMSIISKQTTETTVKPVTPVNNETQVPIKKSDITIGVFCLAIQKTEGWYLPGAVVNGISYPKGSRAYRNNNPGCLSLRDVMGLTTKSDDIGLAIFDSYKDGFMALKNKILNICEGKSTAYSPENTILEFCQIYSPSYIKGNYPENKAKIIGKELNVDYRVFKMKDLL